MIIEGKNNINEAIAAGKGIVKLYVLKGYTDNIVQSIIEAAKEKKAKIQFVDKSYLDKLTPNKHQNVVAEISDFTYSAVSEMTELARSRGEKVLLIILDGIEDPHNLGSIMRSAEIAGAHGIIISRNRAVGVTDTVVRVSAGASHHIKVARVTNINDTIRDLKDNFINIYSADMEGELMYKADMKGDLALVIGGEGSGVSKLTAKLSDKRIAIPMRGRVNSLNAAQAAGIVIYEAVRQRYHNG